MTSRTGSLISMFGTRMCGQTLLFIVIANDAIAFTFKTRNIVHLPTKQHQCTSQDCFWTNFISPHAYLLYILNVHAAKFLDYRNNLFKDVHFVDLQSKWIYIVACNILSIQPCTSPFTIVIQVSLPVEWLSMNSLSSLLLHFQSVLPS